MGSEAGTEDVGMVIVVGMILLVVFLVISMAYHAGKGDLECWGSENPCDTGYPQEQMYDDMP